MRAERLDCDVVHAGNDQREGGEYLTTGRGEVVERGFEYVVAPLFQLQGGHVKCAAGMVIREPSSARPSTPWRNGPGNAWLEERAEYEEKLAARQAKEESTGHKARGKAPEPPQEGPQDKDQYNFTDPESRIMKDGGSFEQCYNAQAAVDVATMIVVGKHVCDAPNDKQQLVPTVAVISPVIQHVSNALVDSGYYSEAAVLTVESGDSGTTVYAAMKRQSHGRSVAQLEARADPPRPPLGASVAEHMAWRLDTAGGKQLYGLRKETVEPVFGIIKEAIGFRRFMLRGLEKAGLEWTLVTTSYNLKRLFNLGMRLTTT